MLDFETFNVLVGTHVSALSAEHGAVPLEVVEVKKADGVDRPDNAFSVLFKGPRELFLEQSTYETTLGEAGTHAVFIVPVIEESDGYVYEAVFTALNAD
jgi:hypothetical protein